MPSNLPNKKVSLSPPQVRCAAASDLALAASLALMLHPTDVFAQSLEDLIPDSAVENPEGWASDGSGPDPVVQDGEAFVPPEPETPLDELPQMTVEWPDDLELSPIEPLDPDENVRFADLGEDPVFTPPQGPVVDLTDSLSISFPRERALFPVQDEFLDRFRELSAIEEFDDGKSNVAQLAARSRADEELLQTMLRVYGYYDARTVRSVVTGQTDIDGDGTIEDPPKVRFDVIPGSRYRFGAIDLGQLDQAADYTKLRNAFEIQSGDFLSSDAIIREQFDLDSALGENGYPFAAINSPELLIDHARAEGDLTMLVLPNGKYAFGGVTSNLPDFLSGQHLETIARFDEGDIYKRSLELDLRRAITATGLVSSVSITPREVEAPTIGNPGTVELDVEMTEAELRTIAGAIGYGSEEGFRIAASWEHRNFFPPEGSVKVRGIAGTQEQLAGITFRRNNLGGRDRILNIDAYASTIDSPAFDARTVALTTSYERVSTLLFQKPLGWSVGLELIATQERPPMVDGVARPRETYFVAALPLYAQIDTSNDLLDPTEGFRLSGRVSPEVSRSNNKQSYYLRGRADASYYKRITDKIVLAGRSAYGAIPGTDLTNIAPSRRYYAGGGGSVRGYGFREIGPRDAEGEPSGGRSVLEVAAEARIRTGFLDGAVSVVPFVDAGTVGTGLTPDFGEFRIGAGVGLRYHTGFGPVRVDVGVPLNPRPDDNPVAVYVSLGQAF